MKICSKCHIENSDNSEFCSSCGTSFVNTQAPNPVESASFNQKYDQSKDYEQYGPQVTILSHNPIINAIKTAGSSKLFLVAIILFSVSTFFGIINALTSTNASAQGLSNGDLFNQMYGGMYGDMYGEIKLVISDGFYAFLNIQTILAIIPPILICVGMWLFYSSSRNNNNESVPTTGLTIIKIATFITMVFLLFIPITIIGTMNGFSSTNEEFMQVLNIALVIALVFVTAFIVLYAFYYIYIIKIINTIKTSIVTAAPLYKISGFVIVMNYIFAGFALLGSFGGGLTSIIGLLKGSFFIVISLGLTAYKNNMMQVAINNNYANTSINT